jgi:hypothetical protein
MTPLCNKLKRVLGPGVWEDADGGLHFAIPEILKFFGLPNTPENHKFVRDVAEQTLQGKNINGDEIKLIHRFDKDGKPNAETRDHKP